MLVTLTELELKLKLKLKLELELDIAYHNKNLLTLHKPIDAQQRHNVLYTLSYTLLYLTLGALGALVGPSLPQ